MFFAIDQFFYHGVVVVDYSHVDNVVLLFFFFAFCFGFPAGIFFLPPDFAVVIKIAVYVVQARYRGLASQALVAKDGFVFFCAFRSLILLLNMWYKRRGSFAFFSHSSRVSCF